MASILSSSHPFRIFLVAGIISLLVLGLVGVNMGTSALIIATVLVLVEVTFSFDNAIINARVLATMSRFWQTLFMTVGILIAVFGMRLVFPIVIVMLTAHLPANQVIDLALNNPAGYSEKLKDSHVAISSFGGMFLLMLSFQFFFDPKRTVRWIQMIERPLQSYDAWWTYTATSAFILTIVTILPFNHDKIGTLIAGSLGILTYLAIHGFTKLFDDKQSPKAAGKVSRVLKTGMAGFMSFLYLEILDASFSFDGVIGAFAITQDVILISIGLGIGAIWVRSLTLFMVRRRTLETYRYLEHGAHYTIALLAGVLLVGLFIDIPEAVAGLTGITIVGLSIMTSIAEKKRFFSRIH